MQTTLPTKQLQEIMELMNRFVSRHTTLPILENIYIKWSIDTLIFRAADMEKYLEIEIPAKIDDEWSLTVNAKTFSDILRSIEDDDVILDIHESSDQLYIKSVNDKFTIRWLPSSEYVALPKVQSDSDVLLPVDDFTKWISMVEFAVTEKNFSPVLTWVYIRLLEQADQKQLVFVWTDSFRLAEYRLPYEQSSTTEFSVIVPKNHINDIKKVAEYALSQECSVLCIKTSVNMMEISCETQGMRIVTSTVLIQWSFPHYEQESIVPTQWNVKAIIHKDQFDKSIKKIGIMTRDLNNYVLVNIDWDTINITSWETDMWDAKTSTAAFIEWWEVTYGANGKYITDFIKMVQGDEFVMHVIDAEKPIVLLDPEDISYKYIVRPLVK